jgi:type II secretory pathway pseudopilin PulG
MSHRCPSRKRRGFTLLELLILLGLLLSLLGFFLAGLARVRNSRDNLASQNKLHNLMIAMVDLSGRHKGRLPPGPVGYFPKNGLVANNGYGPWLFYLLPSLDDDESYNSTWTVIDGKGVYVSWKAVGKSLALLRGPGDPTFDVGSDRTSYLANELALPESGAHFLKSFPDGLSNTILLAEGYSRTTDTVTFGARTVTWKTDRRWWDNPTWKPVPGAVAFQLMPPTDAASSILPQGFAPNGINVGLADGSVKGVDRDCSAKTFYAACTPAGNDVLGNDW